MQYNEGIVPGPFSTLACFTCTNEGIYDGVALAQAVLAIRLVPLRANRWDIIPCERDETTILADARQNKEGYSQPSWHVDSRYAAISHGC
jgi:hypothetical protein